MVRISLAAGLFCVLTAKSTANSSFLAAKWGVLFRRHSVGIDYNNDCVLKGEKFGGEVVDRI